MRCGTEGLRPRRWCVTHQKDRQTDDADRGLSRLGDVKQVIEQRLVTVVSEQVKLVKDKHDRLGRLASPCQQTALRDGEEGGARRGEGEGRR